MKALTVLLSVVPGIEGLICGVFGVIEAIKSPYGGRGFECVNSVSSRPTLSTLDFTVFIIRRFILLAF